MHIFLEILVKSVLNMDGNLTDVPFNPFIFCDVMNIVTFRDQTHFRLVLNTLIEKKGKKRSVFRFSFIF